MVFHEPIGMDVLCVTLNLPDICFIYGVKISTERQKSEVQN